MSVPFPEPTTRPSLPRRWLSRWIADDPYPASTTRLDELDARPPLTAELVDAMLVELARRRAGAVDLDDPPHDRIEVPAEQLGDLLDEARSAVSTLHAVATVETLRPEVHRVCQELAGRLDHAIRSVDDTKRKA